MVDLEGQFDIIEFLRALEALPPAVAGKALDEKVREIWKKWLASGFIRKLPGNKTFFGLIVKDGKGYQIGKNIEVIFETPVPGKGQSNVDIVVLKRTVDDTGRTTRVQITGMDHHTRGPSDPLAGNHNRLHFEKKKGVMEEWGRFLKERLKQENPNAIVETSFEERNSYFWKTRADALRKLRFGKIDLAKYAEEISLVGRIAKASGKLAVIGLKGIEIMDFELRLYQSGTLRRLMEYINRGQISQAEALMRQIRDDPYGIAYDDIWDLFQNFVKVIGIQSIAVGLWPKFIQFLYDEWIKQVEPVTKVEEPDEGETQPPPVTEPQEPVQAPPKIQEHPHTVSPPIPFEQELRLEHVKSEAEFIREQIKKIRAQIRKHKKQQSEDQPWARHIYEEPIQHNMKELERLRKQAKDLGVGTDEEWDEPLEPVGPPPPPPWPLGHDWLHPTYLYVNPKTGEQQWGRKKPPGGDWEPMYDPKTGKLRFRWGWVLRIDPETGEPRWERGWILIEEAEVSYLSPLYEQKISLGIFSVEMKKAQRRGVDIFKIANRNGINLFRPTTQAEFESNPAPFASAVREALQEQVAQRGTVGSGNFFFKSEAERENQQRLLPQD